MRSKPFGISPQVKAVSASSSLEWRRHPHKNLLGSCARGTQRCTPTQQSGSCWGPRRLRLIGGTCRRNSTMAREDGGRPERLPIKVILPNQGYERRVKGGGPPPKPFRPVTKEYRASLSSQVRGI